MHKIDLKIYIISEDLVFIQLIELMIRHYAANSTIQVFKSFVELTENDYSESPDLIILDDIISGATSLEVTSYLRLSKRLISKISFFSHNVYGVKTKAFARGINYFYSKPFDPQTVVKQIINNAYAKTR